MKKYCLDELSKEETMNCNGGEATVVDEDNPLLNILYKWLFGKE